VRDGVIYMPKHETDDESPPDDKDKLN
jgi:hypothetical protein